MSVEWEASLIQGSWYTYFNQRTRGWGPCLGKAPVPQRNAPGVGNSNDCSQEEELRTVAGSHRRYWYVVDYGGVRSYAPLMDDVHVARSASPFWAGFQPT